ncbi:MAG: hypothetical protein H6855_00810 [Rhodospirillales bacterium]|nr:hypothetical protein [Rhodospirillales bacterium]MCB9964609.1 hypothetical protein [Rhodospirillales bacterium]MCB9979898.1 hypothetical protein [Rhodospirillales bacterium]
MRHPASAPGHFYTRDSAEKLPVFFVVIWVLYLLFSPFYIFPKGMPQPADFLLALGIIVALGTEYPRIETRIKPVYLMGGLFVILTMCINLVNYAFYPHPRLLLSMLYYPYNFMIFLYVTWLFYRRPEAMVKISIYALVATLMIQIASTFLMASGYRGARATAGFENPNQLAYWALLTATMVIFLRRLDGQLRPIDYVMLLMAFFLQAIALSKAGIIAFTVFLLFLMVTPFINKIARFLGIVTIVFFSIFLALQPSTLLNIYQHIDFLQNAVERIEGIGTEADDDPGVRGYYRLSQFPFYTVFGAGEGSFERFDPSGRELHSGIATIIFSYGLLGATFFFSFLTLILNRQPWYFILLFLPIILFGLPHQNFRFSHFWVLLGINYGLFLYTRMTSQQNLPKSAHDQQYKKYIYR